MQPNQIIHDDDNISREKITSSETVLPFAAPPPSSADDDSQHGSLSSLTLGSGVSRPRRRQTAGHHSTKRKHWRSSRGGDSDAGASDNPSSSSRGGYYSSRRWGGGGHGMTTTTASSSSSHSHSLLFAGGGGGPSTVINNHDPQSLPSLRVIASELILICSLYCRYVLISLRKPCRRFKRTFFFVTFSIFGFILFMAIWLSLNFYKDAVQVCTPVYNHYGPENRPLVEIYVHGRGIGHYARSVAIVEQLNKAGVDVRMFLTRAAMWRALHEDSETSDRLGSDGTNVGTTTAISVTSLSPKYSIFETVSHIMERIIGDCEVSVKSKRYPQLIISDGDFPGMLRAAVGGIPSVGIAHGQLFNIGQKPSWIQNSVSLNRAWDDQARLNGASSFFSEWQIATNFCFLESRLKTGVVARAPLRPEVLQMTTTRNLARKGTPYPTLPQYSRIRILLLDEKEKKENRTPASNQANTTSALSEATNRRKLVICYFRDRNGDMVVQALLSAGFDVLIFDNGYHKDMQNDLNRYGVNWIVNDREEQRKKQRLDFRNEVHKSSVYDIGSDKAHEAGTQSVGHIVSGDEHTPRLIRVMDRSLFVPLMHVADGIASSAGSQLMSECIYVDMPLLALYRQGDGEQQLNVELSRHPGPCHKPKVCGTSFETLAAGLQVSPNITSSITDPKLAELKRFVGEVRSSRVSDTFYRYRESITEDSNASDRQPEEDENGQQIPSFAEGEDPFQGLPDAGAIILEIIKQVVNDG